MLVANNHNASNRVNFGMGHRVSSRAYILYIYFDEQIIPGTLINVCMDMV